MQLRCVLRMLLCEPPSHLLLSAGRVKVLGKERVAKVWGTAGAKAG